MKIKISNLSKSYGNNIIMDNFNLDIDDKKVNCIMGKSGCGKSTLLNIISGLTSPDNGFIVGINHCDISYVFQEDRLIEWLTVEENLELALKSYYDEDTLGEKIQSLLKNMKINKIKKYYPNSLSGGMKQRVNIARALGKPSKIILMDEPFKSLDYTLKYEIIRQFKDFIKYDKRIVILVTHDIDEAIFFEGKIIVLGDNPLRVMNTFQGNLELNRDDIIKYI